MKSNSINYVTDLLSIITKYTILDISNFVMRNKYRHFFIKASLPIM